MALDLQEVFPWELVVEIQPHQEDFDPEAEDEEEVKDNDDKPVKKVENLIGFKLGSLGKAIFKLRDTNFCN